MSANFSIGKAAAVASAALLIGAYVWHKSNGDQPTIATDTTTSQVGVKQAAAPGGGDSVGPVESSEIHAIPLGEILPGSKSAPVLLPGSKSDSIEIFPGSKSGIVNFPIDAPGDFDPEVLPVPPQPTEQSEERKEQPAPRPVIPSSKSIAPLFDPPNPKGTKSSR